jgi:hypothetical protein
MAMNRKIGKASLEISLESAGFFRSIDRVKRDGLGGLSKEIQSFARRHRQSFLAVGQAAGLIAGGIGAATAAVVALGQKGVAIADVADAFQVLTRNAGGSQAVLAGLQRGTVGVITNFELMRMANKALGAGLVASAADMETLAAGARMLANRTGGDTAEAFDSLTSAMAKGKVAGLKQLGLFVDTKDALAAYTKEHKIAAGAMTDSDRAAALQTATLAALRRELKANDAGAADFGERIDQLKTKWHNFTDDLAAAIATSNVVNEAIGSISAGIDSAFGNDQSERVQRLTSLVNTFVITLVDVGQMGLTVADVMRRGWGALQLVFSGVMSTIFAAGRLFSGLIANLVEQAARVPVVGRQFQEMAWKVRDAANQIRGMQESWHQQSQEALAAAQGNSSFHQSLSKVSSGLTDLRSRLTLVASHQTTAATTTASLTKGINDNTPALERNTTSTKKNADGKAELARKTDETNAANMRWLDILEKAEMRRKRSSMTIPDLTPDGRGFKSDVPALDPPSVDTIGQSLEDLERPEREWREFQNWIGERQMEDEAARLKKLKEMREAALKPFRDLADRVTDAATSNLFTLFTGIGAGDGEAKKRAKEAREDYEQLKASGKASAQEITRAHRTMLETQAQAQSKFSDRFKSWLGGIKQAFVQSINDMVQAWTRDFVGGLLRSLTKGVAAKFGNWVGNVLSGSRGGQGSGQGSSQGGGRGGVVDGLLEQGLKWVFGKLRGPGAGGGPDVGIDTAAVLTPTFSYNPGGAGFGPGANHGPIIPPGGGGLNTPINTAPTTAPPRVTPGFTGAFSWQQRRQMFLDQFGPPGTLANLLASAGQQPLFQSLLGADRDTRFTAAEKAIAAWFAQNGRQVQVFHGGGIVGDERASAGLHARARLTPNERIIKALKGEAVLTPQATAAIGGKPIIDFINAGNGAAIKDALTRGEIKFGDVVSAFFQKVGHKGGIGGFIGGGPGRLVSSMAPRLPVPQIATDAGGSFSAIANRAMENHEAIIRDRVAAVQQRPDSGALVTPAAVSKRDGGGRTYIDNRQFHFSPKGVLDRSSVREIWKNDIAPMAKQEMTTNEVGLRSAVRKAALE